MTELEPLPSDIAELLAAHRAPPSLDSKQVDDAERRLALALGAAQMLGASAAAMQLAKASVWVKLAAFWSRKSTLALAMFGLGSGLGAYVQAQRTPITTAVQSEQAVAVASVVPPVASIVAPSAEPAAATHVAERSAPPVASSSPKESHLAEERALLEMGRTALARGQVEAALAAARSHERTYPRGKLGEEREVLLVQALAASGQKDAARDRAERFVHAHPSSIFVPAIRAAVEP